jgi:hypothetical protein
MTTPDTDEEDLTNEGTATETGDQPETTPEQTHEDTLDERLPDDAEAADADGDGSTDVQDPLLLAQMDDEKPKAKPAPKAPAKVPPKPKEAPKTEDAKANKPAPKDDDKSKQDDDQQADAESSDDDAKAIAARVDAEDWAKVSHKTKSQFLSLQRIARTSQAAVTKAKAEAEQASKDYQEVDQFRQRHQLDPTEFMQAVSLGGALKSGRKDVIPFLEQTLDALRKHHGIPVPKDEPAVPAIDADELAKLVEGAENFDLDAITKLKAIAAKAKEAKTAKAAQPPPAQPAAKQPADDRRQPAADSDASEFTAMHEALVALGVDESRMEAHVAQLIKDITGGDPAKLPAPGQRLRAIVAAHNKRIQAAKQPPVKPKPVIPPPMSGRTGVTRTAVGRDPSTPVDPLDRNHAFKR